MHNWKVAARRFKLHLIINGLERLPTGGDLHGSKLIVQIEWRGPRSRTTNLSKKVVRNCTSEQCIKPDGTVKWNEEYDHVCKLKMSNSGHFRHWDIGLEIHELGLNSDGKTTSLSKVLIDIAEFPRPATSSDKKINIPVRCNIGGSTAEASLTLTLKFSEHQTEDFTVHPLAKVLILPPLPCVRVSQPNSNRSQNVTHHEGKDKTNNGKHFSDQSASFSNSESSSDNEIDFKYENLAATNRLAGVISTTTEYRKEKQVELQLFPTQEGQQQPSLMRLLSWKKGKPRFRAAYHPRDVPLLNKAYGEDGGDDIDNDRRYQMTKQQTRQVPLNEYQVPTFEDDDHFEIGAWEKKTLVSRDGQIELVTEVFLASIDQRSEKASGGGACTVLAAVIADWLHRNPGTLPLRCQFDNLIHGGSSEWRNLCSNENHKEKFSDHHFDLETILEAKVRPLSVVSEMSYIGFFELNNMPEHLEFLEGTMSFDNIWKELLGNAASEERIYIIGWNDHFFILKEESNAIYIIDTLGERLYEGCNQAYILKFDKESAVYRLLTDQTNQKAVSEENTSMTSNGARLEKSDTAVRSIVCQGKASCKEYIKEFLAALPLRELQDDIERGWMGKAPLHRRLQIEFHYTVPSIERD